jgi:hypothetical protein
MTYNLASPSPYVKIAGSNIGLDGNYYTVMDGVNFVLVEQSGAYAIYFSNSKVTPKSCGTLKDAELVAGTETPGAEFCSVYPNPADTKGSVAFDLANISDEGAVLTIFDLNGKVVYTDILRDTHTIIGLNGKFGTGLFIVRITNGSEQYYTKLIIR